MAPRKAVSDNNSSAEASARPGKRPRSNAPPSPNTASTSAGASDHEKEKKAPRPKPPLSCGECRRLKLKCDRVFPCQSCVKRGCGGICPEGSLISGRGSRYILANTEQLHEKILQMAERIRVLEDALDDLHKEQVQRTGGPASVEPSIHPLLRGELLLIKSQLELYGIDPSQSASSSRLPPDSVLATGSSDTSVATSPVIDHQILPSSMEMASDVSRTEQNIVQEYSQSYDTLRVDKVKNEDEPFFGHTARAEYFIRDDDDRVLLPPPMIPTNIGRSTSMISSTLDNSASFAETSSSTHPVIWGSRINGTGIIHALRGPTHGTRLQQQVREALPPRTEAKYLVNTARVNALWQLNLGMDADCLEVLLGLVYDTALPAVCLRNVALLLMLLVIGKCVNVHDSSDSNNISESSNTGMPEDSVNKSLPTEDYYQLAWTALTAFPIVEEPDLTVVQCLFLMTWYLLIFSDRKQAGKTAWGVMGLTAKLAQSIGLHRESPYQNITPDRQNERRILFWEILHLDASLSLAMGRPSSFSLAHVDCRRPSVYASLLEAQFYNRKFTFYEECLVPLMELSVRTQQPDYLEILALDRKIRELPDYEPFRQFINGRHRERCDVTLPAHVHAMVRANAFMDIESALLQLHRGFYSLVLRSGSSNSSSSLGANESDDAQWDPILEWLDVMSSKYAPSVFATFQSACRILQELAEIYQKQPELSVRYSVYWFNGFCGAAALCLLVSRVPSSPLAPMALQELTRATHIFHTASAHCPKAERSHHIIRDLTAKCTATYLRWKNSIPAGPSAGPSAISSASDLEAACNERLRAIAERSRYISQGAGCNLLSTHNTESGTSNDWEVLQSWEHVHSSVISFMYEVASGSHGRAYPSEATGTSASFSSLRSNISNDIASTRYETQVPDQSALNNIPANIQPSYQFTDTFEFQSPRQDSMASGSSQWGTAYNIPAGTVYATNARVSSLHGSPTSLIPPPLVDYPESSTKSTAGRPSSHAINSSYSQLVDFGFGQLFDSAAQTDAQEAYSLGDVNRGWTFWNY